MKFILLILLTIQLTCVNGQVFKPITVDPTRNYKIKNEGKLKGWFDEPEPINSDIIVNNDSLTAIQFTKAKFKGDTLDIEIYQTDPSHDHHYRIQIVKNQYTIDYQFSYPVDTIERKLKPIDYKMILEKKNLERGTHVRGYTEIRSQCIQNCYNKIVTAAGNFKVLIK